MNSNITPIHAASNDNSLLNATVKGSSTQTILIDTGSGIINASLAFSCLVAPEEGDIVLVSQSSGEYHVLSILERPKQSDMTLSFPGSVKMHAKAGKLDLVAREEISLTTPGATKMMSDQMHIASSGMNINTVKLNTTAHEIEAHSKSVTLSTGVLNTVAKQISQKTDLLVRWVEGVETLNIGNLIQNIRQNYTTHSDQAIITAKKDMRIDGERIHMG